MEENLVFQASKVINSDLVSDISEAMKYASYFFRETTKREGRRDLLRNYQEF